MSVLTTCSPESIPHLSQQQSNGQIPTTGSLGGGGPSLHPTLSQGQSGSPVKESTLQRGMSVDEQEPDEIAKGVEKAAEEKEIPIRKS